MSVEDLVVCGQHFIVEKLVVRNVVGQENIPKNAIVAMGLELRDFGSASLTSFY